jgi:hypothetical protein
LAKEYGARVIVLHVAPPVIGYGAGVIPPASEEYQEALLLRSRRGIQRR